MGTGYTGTGHIGNEYTKGFLDGLRCWPEARMLRPDARRFKKSLMIKGLIDQAGVPVPMPRDDYECEMGTGEDHKILHWEVFVQCFFSIDVDGYASGLELEYEVLWVVCSCGHWTELY